MKSNRKMCRRCKGSTTETRPHSFSVSYDRFVAICCPLRYPVLMSPRLCLLLVVVSWLLGATDGLVQAGVTMSYRFCRSREVNHFFCEAPALVRLACDDTTVFESVMYVCCIVMLLIPFSVLMGSYGLILGTILRMRSIEAKKKTFTTCSSHLSVVGLFYGTTIYIYMRPSSYDSTDYDKVVSAFYTILTPVLNALIYSLKNREVLRALKRGLIDCSGLFLFSLIFFIFQISLVHLDPAFTIPWAEGLLLASMRYDPYVAISSPLTYPAFMRRRRHGLMAL
ncbi:olfactory receptor 2T12-like [Tachyglossus aculeatus]|uniref:olfactory receptor 2T12-like n=1 Tax=Tachyglossus aculeatus TaxID=9261 RepID=UPI0018F2901E|nr:olfactory receptor 2T12-like [Tachyglossus aculeatus]